MYFYLVLQGMQTFDTGSLGNTIFRIKPKNFLSFFSISIILPKKRTESTKKKDINCQQSCNVARIQKSRIP